MKLTVKNYTEYLKDNPERYWFKRKLYGWGWIPATWQGWLILFGFIVIIVLNFYRIDATSNSDSDTLIKYIFQTFVLVLLLVAICWNKGEKPKWQWGLPDKSK